MAITRTRYARRRNLRRYWRRTTLRPRGRRARTNRLLRRFIRRSNKPELKWGTANFVQSINENTAYSNSCSLLSIANGASRSQRIGNQVRLVKNDLNVYVRDNSYTQSNVAAPAVQSYQVRIIIWSPRLQLAQANTHMGAMLFTSFWDHNIVNVYKDFICRLSPPYMAEATTADIAGGPFGYSKMYKFKIPFPRKASFNDSENLLDPDRDVMYITYIIEDTPGSALVGINTRVECKTYYYDN